MRVKKLLIEKLKQRYSPPVDQLFQVLPKLEIWAPWLNYREKFGLSRDDIPQLIQMVQDHDIIWADYDTMPEIRDAQIHAWRALSELPSAKAVPVLIDIWANADPESDLENEDILRVLSEIGQGAVEPVAKIFRSKKYPSEMKLSACECLKEIGLKHPNLRNKVVRILGKRLSLYKSNSREVNSFLIAGLIDLDAANEYMPLFERAFDHRLVDLSMNGDLEEIKVELGIMEKRITPLPEGTTNWMQIDAMIEEELEQEALERERNKRQGEVSKRTIKKKVKRLNKNKKKKKR